jgi:hypothetical protein
MTSGINKQTGKNHKFIDRTGSRNGRLLFKEYLGVNAHKHGIWMAICDCGKSVKTSTPHKTKSCGCLRSELMSNIQKSKALPPDERKKRQLENRKRQHAKRRSDPIKSMQSRLSRLHRWCLSYVSAIKTSPTFEQLGYTPSEFKTHIEKQFHDGMCWENMSDWQIDHITPMASAKDIDDVIRLNQLSNLRPMWAKLNNKKNNKIEFLI